MVARSPTVLTPPWVQVDGYWQFPAEDGVTLRLRPAGARWFADIQETRPEGAWDQTTLSFDGLAEAQAGIEEIAGHRRERAALERREIALSSHRPEGTPWGVAQTKLIYSDSNPDPRDSKEPAR